MHLSTEQLERRSYHATIAASLVAIASFIIGLIQFSITQSMQRDALELERETQIISLNNEYQKLQQETVEAASKTPQEAKPKTGSSEGDLFDWRENLSISIAESIYNLDNDRDWDTTVKTMVVDHRDYILAERLECDTYTPKFIKFVKDTLKDSQFCKDEY